MDWQLALRDTVTKGIIGFVAMRPTTLRIRKECATHHIALEFHLCDYRSLPFRVANFLCVHKVFRGHGIAPLLIREVARRASLEGYIKCIYPSLEPLECRLPLTRCRYVDYSSCSRTSTYDSSSQNISSAVERPKACPSWPLRNS